MKTFALTPALDAGISTASLADATQDHRLAVISCLGNMEGETSRDQCRNRMFAPCVAHSVGDAAHLACLTRQRGGWRLHLDGETEVLNARLTTEGNTELTGILGQWCGDVGQKCAEVAGAKKAISTKAAEMGCEISEFAGWPRNSANALATFPPAPIAY